MTKSNYGIICTTTSLREAILVATKQSKKTIKNGLLRRLTSPRNDTKVWLYTMFDTTNYWKVNK